MEIEEVEMMIDTLKERWMGAIYHSSNIAQRCDYLCSCILIELERRDYYGMYENLHGFREDMRKRTRILNKISERNENAC
jgi:hypothetical protein